MAQSQKRVIILNNASRVSDRPTCLTFCCNKMSKNAEWIRNIVFSSVGLHSQPHLASAKSVQTECRTWKLVFESYAEVQPDFAKQRYNTKISKSKFFCCLISHLESFPQLWMGIQPFIYGHSGAFSTREKKWNRDISFWSRLNFYEIQDLP